MFSDTNSMVNYAIRMSDEPISKARVSEALLGINFADMEDVREALAKACQLAVMPRQVRNSDAASWVWRAVARDRYSREYLKTAWSWIESVQLGEHDLGMREWLIASDGARMHAVGVDYDGEARGWQGWRDAKGKPLDREDVEHDKLAGMGRYLPCAVDEGRDINLREEGRYEVVELDGGSAERVVAYVIADGRGVEHAYRAQYVWDVAGKAGELRWYVQSRATDPAVFAPVRGADRVAGGLAVVMPMRL